MPPAERRIAKVRILDQEYCFASKGEEADAHIRQVARLVDEKMRDVGRNAGNTTPMQTAVLTGLELVDERQRVLRPHRYPQSFPGRANREEVLI